MIDRITQFWMRNSNELAVQELFNRHKYYQTN